MSNFKLIFVSVFAGIAVIAVLVFSGIINLGGSSSKTEVEGSVTLWGTFDTRSISPFLLDYTARNQKVQVVYVEKDPATFENSLIEAIASGTVPDLVLLPDNLLFRFQDKVTHIPFTSLSERTFADTFVSGASIFSAADGYLAVPWASDPIVMYYNRDLLQGAGIVKAPATWTAFAETVPKLAKKLPDLTLTQNAVALGTFKNIGHAKDIIALLFIQNGNPFVTNTLGAVSTHFGSANRGDEFSSAVEAMSFYMAFSDPNKNVYTWNSGEPLDLQAFIESKLVYYFGSASELPGIRSQNPNLNFDVALPPQGSETNAMTSGRFYGLAIPKIAPNQLLSFTAAQLLASTDSSRALTEQAGTTLALMPVRRDVLAQAPVSDKYLSLLYTAALVNRSWFDPNPASSTAIFSTLVSDISSGLLTVEQSLDKAATRIEALGIRGL